MEKGSRMDKNLNMSFCSSCSTRAQAQDTEHEKDELSRRFSQQQEELQNLLQIRLSKRWQEIKEDSLNKLLEHQDLLLKKYRDELDLYSEELDNLSKKELEAILCIDDITQEVEHERSAISADMELFRKNLLELMKQMNSKIEAVMDQARIDVECQVTEMASNNEQLAQKWSRIQEKMESFMLRNKRAGKLLVHEIESHFTGRTSNLNTVTPSTSKYTLYSPSDNMLAKIEYHPLTFTSEHEQNCDEDSILLDLRRLFNPPSPTTNPNNLMKSTSDIYSHGKEQTKENPDRSISFKRPYKPPAPSSMK